MRRRGVQIKRANSNDILTGVVSENTEFGKWVTLVDGYYKAHNVPDAFLSDGGPFFKEVRTDLEVLTDTDYVASGSTIGVVEGDTAEVYDVDLVAQTEGVVDWSTVTPGTLLKINTDSVLEPTTSPSSGDVIVAMFIDYDGTGVTYRLIHRYRVA